MQKMIQGFFMVVFIGLLMMSKMNIWLLLFGLSWIITFALGRVYCGYVCPMNTAMQWTTLVKKKLGLKDKQAPKWLTSKALRVLMLLLFVGIFIASAKLGVKMPILLILLGISVFITFVYSEVVFHRTLCPFGTLLALPARFSKFGLKIEASCVNCGLCAKKCPNDAIEKNEGQWKIDATECLVCHQCQKACKKDAVQFSKL